MRTREGRTRTTLDLVVVMLGLLALAVPARAKDEVQVYGIAKFGGSGRCGDSDMTHPVHTDTAAAFAKPFSIFSIVGMWDTVDIIDNGDARSSYFTDSSKAGSCSCTADDTEDRKGADNPDIIFVHTHGTHSESSPAYSGLWMGKDASGLVCVARTDKNMLWNSDLDIAVIKACQSGDYDTWANGGYWPQFTRSGSALRMWNAFHGNSSCGDFVTDYVSDYAWESLFDGVGENWLDEAYDSNGSDDDDCPVSIVIGETRSKRDNLFENGGWMDRKSTGSKTDSTYYYFGGCHPSSGRKLPS